MPPFFLFFALNYPFFALNYLISASYFLKTAFLLANQNREIFVCVLLMVLLPKWLHANTVVIYIVENFREYSQATKAITEQLLYSVRTPPDSH